MAQAKPQAAERRDPVVVDSAHYTIESEDERVRVLRVRYEPGGKSVMHGHPATVAVFLSDTKCRFTYPDGRTEEHDIRAGSTMVMPAMEHLPENLGNKPLEVILVELKGQ
jgi:quercetin dioxygenase-like cupin family protein